MESEKVKEIKEKLQEEIFIANSFGDKLRKVPTKELENLLTLINELESENETLKDEITESEKEKRQLCKAINSIRKGFDNGEFISKDCKTKTLKQFAERLKNKLFEFFQDNEELDGKISVGPLYVDVIGVEAKDGTIISLGLIDELLKEYEVEE